MLYPKRRTYECIPKTATVGGNTKKALQINLFSLSRKQTAARQMEDEKKLAHNVSQHIKKGDSST